MLLSSLSERDSITTQQGELVLTQEEGELLESLYSYSDAPVEQYDYEFLRRFKRDTSTTIYYFKDSIYYFTNDQLRRLSQGYVFGCYNEYPGLPGIYQLWGGDVSVNITQTNRGGQYVESTTLGNT